MKRDLLLEKGVMPSDVDSQDYYDFLEVLTAPETELTEAGGSSIYDDMQWADE